MDSRLEALVAETVGIPTSVYQLGSSIQALSHRLALSSALVRLPEAGPGHDPLTRWNRLQEANAFRIAWVCRIGEIADKLGIRELGRHRTAGGPEKVASPVSRGIRIVTCRPALLYRKDPGDQAAVAFPCKKSFFCPHCWCRFFVNNLVGKLLVRLRGPGSRHREIRLVERVWLIPRDPAKRGGMSLRDLFAETRKAFDVNWRLQGVTGGASLVAFSPSEAQEMYRLTCRYLILGESEKTRRVRTPEFAGRDARPVPEFLARLTRAVPEFRASVPERQTAGLARLPGAVPYSTEETIRPKGRINRLGIIRLAGRFLQWPAGWLFGDPAAACELIRAWPDDATRTLTCVGELYPDVRTLDTDDLDGQNSAGPKGTVSAILRQPERDV